MKLEFEVAGPPKPWQRAGHSRNGRSYMPTATKQYQEAIKTMAALACSSAGLAKSWPTDAQYRVTILAMFGDNRRRDIDNIAKSVLDALSKVLYRDDTQVSYLAVEKTVSAAYPRTEVTVEVLA